MKLRAQHTDGIIGVVGPRPTRRPLRILGVTFHGMIRHSTLQYAVRFGLWIEHGLRVPRLASDVL